MFCYYCAFPHLAYGFSQIWKFMHEHVWVNFVNFFFFLSHRYDTEAEFFDEEVKNAKRNQMVSRVLEVSLDNFLLLQRLTSAFYSQRWNERKVYS